MAAVSPTPDTASVSAADFASHQRQFSRVVHVLKWLVIHLLIMLPALYFLVVAGQPIAGMLFVFIALGALAYGILSTPTAARDAMRALQHRPDAG